MAQINYGLYGERKLNLKVGFMIVLYYSFWILILTLGSSVFLESKGYTHNIELNDSELDSSEIDRGGFFGTGVSFARFFTIIAFGIGLPESIPSLFKFVFAVWQTVITILSVMWGISSVWNG